MSVNDYEYSDTHSSPHHITPVPTYYAIFGALMVLTAITVAVAFVDLGVFSTPVAILIAVVKATLVILWFMHVKYNSRMIWLVVIGSFIFLAILFVWTLFDYLSRHFIMT